jgi:hypothetical protein
MDYLGFPLAASRREERVDRAIEVARAAKADPLQVSAKFASCGYGE